MYFTFGEFSADILSAIRQAEIVFLETFNASLTAFKAAIFDKSRITEAHVRSRANSIRATVGAVRKTSEWIGFIENVTPVAGTTVGSCTFTIQAGVITRWFTGVSQRAHFVARFAGARIGAGTCAVETTVLTHRFTSLIGYFISLVAFALPRSNALSMGTVLVTLWNALSLQVPLVACQAHTIVCRHTTPSATASCTAWNAELVRLIQLESLITDANPEIQVTLAVVAANRTCGYALVQIVFHVIRVALAGVRTHTQTVHAGLLTDRLTLAEVVHISFVALTANLYSAQRRVGPISNWNVPSMRSYQAGCWNFLEAHAGRNIGFSFVHKSVEGTPGIVSTHGVSGHRVISQVNEFRLIEHHRAFPASFNTRLAKDLPGGTDTHH